jgi:flagellar protein FlaG
MNTINPVANLIGLVAAPRSDGASARPAPTEVTPVVALGAVAGPTTPAAQALQAGQAPVQQANREAERKPEDSEDLQRQLDDTLKDVQTSLRFRVDDEVNRVVVSVVDRGSGDVIYQIPSEAALQIAKRMAELGSGMINESA